MSSLITLTPDLHLQARLEEMASRASEAFVTHQKSADNTPKDNSQRSSFQILANNAQFEQNQFRLLAHAIGSGRSIQVSPSLYERIFP